MAKMIEQIATTLDGEKLVTSGYGTYVLATKAWEKNGKSRVYFDGRFVDSEGRISAHAQRLGHVELLSSGDLVYATKSYHEHAMRDLVEPVLADISANLFR